VRLTTTVATAYPRDARRQPGKKFPRTLEAHPSAPRTRYSNSRLRVIRPNSPKNQKPHRNPPYLTNFHLQFLTATSAAYAYKRIVPDQSQPLKRRTPLSSLKPSLTDASRLPSRKNAKRTPDLKKTSLQDKNPKPSETNSRQDRSQESTKSLPP